MQILINLVFSVLSAHASDKTSEQLYDRNVECLRAAADLSVFLDTPPGNSQTKVMGQDGKETLTDKFFTISRSNAPDSIFQIGADSKADQLDKKTKKIVSVPVRGILVIDGDGFLLGRRLLEEDLNELQNDLEKFQNKASNSNQFKEVISRWALLPVSEKKFTQEFENTFSKNLDLWAKTLAEEIENGKHNERSYGEKIKSLYGQLQDRCSSRFGVSQRVSKKVSSTFNEIVFPKLKIKFPDIRKTQLNLQSQ